jgi:hypothetical protein
VRAGFLIRVAAAFRGLPAGRMPAGSGLAALADVPDRERRDGFSQLVVRCKHSVIPMPVLPRRRDEIGEPVQKLKRREFDNAVGPRPRGLAAAARPDPVGGFVSGQHVADFGYAAVCTADHGEPLQCEIMRKLLEIGYDGYVGQEFIPTRDPLAGLREAVALCDV